jgi:SAM-dependent methyltransferase
MEFTGERVIPSQSDVDLYNEHRARYWFARRFAPGRTVLDAACGTGYGSAMLAEASRSVVGVDIARDALDYAAEHFRAPNLRFAQADCLTLPFPADRFDLVVAFEIIEHLDAVDAFLAELRRVLDASGVLVLSTPNRLYYTDDRGEINPFHRKEFSYPEFDEVLRPHFAHRAILFQNHVAGLAISGPDAEWNGSALSADCFFQEETGSSGAEASRRGAHFFVAVCSAQPIRPIEPLLYLPSAANILRDRELHIHLLEQRLSERDAYVLRLQAEYDQKIDWACSLERDLAKARGDLQALQEDHARKIEWAHSLESDLDKARNDLDGLRKEFEERTAWALRLDQELKQRSEEVRRLSEELHLLVGSRWYRMGKKLNLSPALPSDRGPSGTGS